MVQAPGSPWRRWRRPGLLSTAGLLSLVAGVAVATLTVSNPSQATAIGNYQANTGLNYWIESTVTSTTEPNPTTLTTLSTTSSTPSNLGTASISFAINTGTTNDKAVEFTYLLLNNVTANQEIELTFTVGTQSGSTVSAKGYVNANRVPGPAGTSYSFYYDLGTASASIKLLITTETQSSQACQINNPGHCP